MVGNTVVVATPHIHAHKQTTGSTAGAPSLTLPATLSISLFLAHSLTHMCDGFDQDAVSQHEFVVNTKQLRPVGELVPQGAHDGDTRLVGVPVECVMCGMCEMWDV